MSHVAKMRPIGKVTHYYNKLGVAIVELTGDLKVGDRIKIEGGKNEFEQTVESMEVDRKSVSLAVAGDVVGLKVSEKAREGSLVLKAEE